MTFKQAQKLKSATVLGGDHPQTPHFWTPLPRGAALSGPPIKILDPPLTTTVYFMLFSEIDKFVVLFLQARSVVSSAITAGSS